MPIALNAKSTYIPTYVSYIHIVNGTDTITKESNLDELTLSESDGMFTITIEHEQVTKEKIKSIKRAKRAAAWAGVSAVMSGVSTAFSKNSLQYMVRSSNTSIAANLADIYKTEAEDRQQMSIAILIDNNTDGELMVNDMERGLTWYIMPRSHFPVLYEDNIMNILFAFPIWLFGKEAFARVVTVTNLYISLCVIHTCMVLFYIYLCVCGCSRNSQGTE